MLQESKVPFLLHAMLPARKKLRLYRQNFYELVADIDVKILNNRLIKKLYSLACEHLRNVRSQSSWQGIYERLLAFNRLQKVVARWSKLTACH